MLKLYKPYLFEQAMQFEPNDIYNRKDHNLSLNRLINLGVFKFVKNRFERDTTTPFAQLNTLLPHAVLKSHCVRELNGTSKSNNLVRYASICILGATGITFRAGELLKITASGGAEVQYSSAQQGYNVYRIGTGRLIDLSRFLIPFFKLNPKGGFVPKTNMMLGYDMLNKKQAVYA